MSNYEQSLIELIDAAKEIEPFVGDIRMLGDWDERDAICKRFKGAVAAIMGDASTRKDEGCAGTTVSAPTASTLATAPVIQGEISVPFDIESKGFESWAGDSNMDMHQHPLHYLFLDERTYLARQAWKAAIAFMNQKRTTVPVSGDDVRKRLWNPVIALSNNTQIHDADELNDFLYHLKLKHGDEKIGIKKMRRDSYNMEWEHRIFDRVPDTQETVELSIGQMIDVVMGAVSLLYAKGASS